MYGKFFEDKFWGKSPNERNFLFKENVTDVVFYNPNQVIAEFYHEILESEYNDEIYESISDLFDIAYKEGFKQALYAISQTGLELITALQKEDENV